MTTMDNEPVEEVPDSYKDCLVRSRDDLVQKLSDVEDILLHLVSSAKAITEIQYQVILAETTNFKRIQTLLDRLVRRGEDACVLFVLACHYTEQSHLLTLSPDLKKDIAAKSSPVAILAIDRSMDQLRKHYRKKIEDKDKREENIFGNKLKLEDHEPTLINCGYELPESQIRTGFNEFSTEEKERDQLTLDELFKSDGSSASRPHTILMLGAPGMGKTSLFYTILYRYISNNWRYHSYVFHIPLSETDRLPPQQTLTDLLFRNADCTPGEKERIVDQLKQKQHEVLILLDGYDETADFMDENISCASATDQQTANIILCSLVRGDLLPDAQVVLTSRPCCKVHRGVDQNHIVELAGLERKSIENLTAKLVTDNTAEEIKEFLHSNPDVFSLLTIPLNFQKFLSYIMWLKENSQDIITSLPKTKCELFCKQMISILSQTTRKTSFRSEKAVWTNDAVKTFLKGLVKLAEKAFDNTAGRQIYFTEEDLNKCGLSGEDVEKFGLMSSYKQKNGEMLYFFVHLTTLEWCGGINLVLSKLRQIRAVIKKNKGHIDAVLGFAIGMLRDENGRKMLNTVFNMSPEDCESRAADMLPAILESERCCQLIGGLQFALDIYAEGQYQDPTPMLKFLSSKGRKLKMKNIALHTIRPLQYFLHSINDFNSEQAERIRRTNPIVRRVKRLVSSTTGIDVITLSFAPTSAAPEISSIVGEVCQLDNLKELQIRNDVSVKILDGQTTTRRVKVNFETKADDKTIQGLVSGLCQMKNLNMDMETVGTIEVRGDQSTAEFTLGPGITKELAKNVLIGLLLAKLQTLAVVQPGEQNSDVIDETNMSEVLMGTGVSEEVTKCLVEAGWDIRPHKLTLKTALHGMSPGEVKVTFPTVVKPATRERIVSGVCKASSLRLLKIEISDAGLVLMGKAYADNYWQLAFTNDADDTSLLSAARTLLGKNNVILLVRSISESLNDTACESHLLNTRQIEYLEDDNQLAACVQDIKSHEDLQGITSTSGETISHAICLMHRMNELRSLSVSVVQSAKEQVAVKLYQENNTTRGKLFLKAHVGNQLLEDIIAGFLKQSDISALTIDDADTNTRYGEILLSDAAAELLFSDECEKKIKNAIVAVLSHCDHGLFKISTHDGRRSQHDRIVEVAQQQELRSKILKAEENLTQNTECIVVKDTEVENSLDWLLDRNDCLMLDMESLPREGADAVSEGDMQLLYMRGEMSNTVVEKATETAQSQTLFIHNTRGGWPKVSLKKVSGKLRELYLYGNWVYPDTSEWGSVTAVSGLKFDWGSAERIVKLIESQQFEAVGMRIGSVRDEQLKPLSSALRLSHIKCLDLELWDETLHYICSDVIKDIKDLSELWLTFLNIPSDDNVKKISVSLCDFSITTLGLFYSINISSFLKIISQRSSSIQRVITDDDISRDQLTKAGINWSGTLIKVRKDRDSYFYAPLTLSNYFMKSVPQQTKNILTSRFVDPEVV